MESDDNYEFSLGIVGKLDTTFNKQNSELILNKYFIYQILQLI